MTPIRGSNGDVKGHVYSFETNCLIMPPIEIIKEINDNSDIITYIVERGQVLLKDELFVDIFEDRYDFLVVTPLPDFDIECEEATDNAIQLYEDNLSKYTSCRYEIAREYH